MVQEVWGHNKSGIPVFMVVYKLKKMKFTLKEFNKIYFQKIVVQALKAKKDLQVVLDLLAKEVIIIVYKLNLRLLGTFIDKA